MTREMKNSGNPWLLRIPLSWKTPRIKNHFIIVGGTGFPIDFQDSNGTFPVYKAGDISTSNVNIKKSRFYLNSSEEAKKLGFKIIPSNSILLPKIGEAMKKNSRALSTTECAVDNNCEAFIPLDINPQFAYYYFSLIDMGLYDSGGPIPSLNNQAVMNLTLPYPPKDEQISISSYLNVQCSKIDQLSDNLDQQIETLKEYKKSVITQAVTKGLDPDVEMKDSRVEWIGEIPANWEVISFKNWFSSITDGTHFSPETLSDGFPYITATDVRGVGLNLEKAKKISEEDYQQLKRQKCEIEKNDILLVKDGATTGRVGIVDSDDKAVVLSSVAILKINNESIPKFAYYALQSDLFDNQIKLSMAGAAMPRTTLEKIKGYVIIVPCAEEQQLIVDYLDFYCDKIDKLIQNIQDALSFIGQYKKSLIFDYVTGKKEVPPSFLKENGYE